MGLRTILCLGVACASVLTACAAPREAAVETEAPPSIVQVSADLYDKVFEASIQELRDRRFVVNRQDRRFGLIQTQPLTASSIFEPWHRDKGSLGQTAASSLNHDRKIVSVSLEPLKEELDAFASGGPAPATYQIHLRVDIERRSLPPQPLTTAAQTGIGVREAYRRQAAIRTEEGLQEVRWKPVGRDKILEARLMLAILDRAGLEVE